MFDNCVSYKLAQMLKCLDVDSVASREVLPENAKDTEIFDYLRENKPIVFVSCDRRQTRVAEECNLLKEIKVTAVYFEPFWNRRLRLWEQASWLVKHWPTIENWAESSVSGSVGAVKQRGRIEAIKL